jgi:hypothetical protein
MHYGRCGADGKRGKARNCGPSVRHGDETGGPAVGTMVRWENTDTDRAYTVTGRDDEFGSPPIPPGGSWELDVSEIAPGVYRYYIPAGQALSPGTIEIAPAE